MNLNVKVLLGDVARVAEGKLDVLGAGWVVAGPGPVNLGIGLIVEVPWEQMDTKHKFEILLQDGIGTILLGDDGKPVMQFEGELVVARPPGVILGLPAVNCLAVNVNGLQLPPGQRYRLQVTVDEVSDPQWTADFSTRPATMGPSQLAV